ncbi:unnamed protein product [Prunus armeniaca]
MGLASVREGGRGCGGDEKAGEGDAVASKDGEDAAVGIGDEGEEPERTGGEPENYLYCPRAGDIQRENFKHFQWHWFRGEPVIVSNETTKGLSWEPLVMWHACRQICNILSMVNIWKSRALTAWIDVSYSARCLGNICILYTGVVINLDRGDPVHRLVCLKDHPRNLCPYLNYVPKGEKLGPKAMLVCLCCNQEDGHPNRDNWVGVAAYIRCSKCGANYDHRTKDCPVGYYNTCWYCKKELNMSCDCPENG